MGGGSGLGLDSGSHQAPQGLPLVGPFSYTELSPRNAAPRVPMVSLLPQIQLRLSDSLMKTNTMEDKVRCGFPTGPVCTLPVLHGWHRVLGHWEPLARGASLAIGDQTPVRGSESDPPGYTPFLE